MFTGIIEACKPLGAVSRSAGLMEIAIDLGELAEGVALGESIALNGVCLTVASLSGSTARFQAVRETQERSTLGGLRQGDPVNVERSLRVGDRLGGHFVQGHVDGVGTLSEKKESEGQCLIRVIVPTDLTRMMIAKGSVAIDGVSLTLVDVAPDSFSVAIIPHTLENTTLRVRRPGDKVNIEVDMIGKYVAKLLGKDGGGLTIEKLERYGFA
ncbi:MAG: riboflavin synthase [Planctomycetes bacterium]|nr:riboflavin synthase [Planctomycetota bacterium]